jgi:hypothetical protein
MVSLVKPADRSRIAWCAAAAGPVCWFAQLLTSFAFIARACVNFPSLLAILAWAFTIPVFIAALAAWKIYQLGPGTTESTTATGRARFVELLGLIMPLIFLVAMLWQDLAVVFFPPCDR